MSSDLSKKNKTEEQYDLLEQEVSELEDYIRDFWEFIPVPIVYINPAGIIMDADKSVTELLGIAREDIGMNPIRPGPGYL